MEFVFEILETHCLLFCSDIHKLLLPRQCGDDEEGTDRLVAPIVLDSINPQIIFCKQ